MIPTKKVRLLIVEGESEKLALEAVLSKLISSSLIKFKVIGNDITSDHYSSANTIVNRIKNIVKRFIKENKFNDSDIYDITHIIDTDGAFINDIKIEAGKVTQYTYEDHRIICDNPERARKRNKKKSDCIRVLMNNDRIKINNNEIPYRSYYMSCNLDHVLYNKRNNKNKKSEAIKFSNKYIDNIEAFVKFICNNMFSAEGTYDETWKHIMTDDNSLNRHTNINIYVKEN